MTYKVGAKGQVVLPKELRERHGIQPGDEVVFDERDDDIVVRRASSKADIVRDLLGSLGPSDVDPLAVLMDEKRRDREREARKLEPLR